VQVAIYLVAQFSQVLCQHANDLGAVSVILQQAIALDECPVGRERLRRDDVQLRPQIFWAMRLRGSRQQEAHLSVRQPLCRLEELRPSILQPM
jgi:hypothetical protein